MSHKNYALRIATIVIACAVGINLTGCSGPEPLSAESTITYRKADDPDLAKAAAEARSKWSIFSKAFASRDKISAPGNKPPLFQVKAAATGDGKTEHFWVNVDDINSDDISGKYDCDGVEVISVHENDPVHVKLANIEDWMLTNDGHKQGGFSILVLIHKGIAQTNQINVESADQGAAQYAKLKEHWAKLANSAGANATANAKGEAALTKVDRETMELVDLVDRIELGNTGRVPTDEDLAKTCHLPVEMVKSIRHVRKSQG